MDVMSHIFSSLETISSVGSLLWIFSGTALGIVFGAAPGLTATTAVALFTPITFYMDISTSMCFLMGIYCGGFYAGSIPAILLNTPGAPGNAATVMDGYPMAKQGLAGKALGYSIVSSWIGGSISAVALLFFAPLIGRIALRFGPAEYFSVAVLGLVCVAGVSRGGMAKSIAGAVIGMLLGTIGMDPISGVSRFTFGNVNMLGGIALIPALVGFFAITEVLAKAENLHAGENDEVAKVASVKTDISIYWRNKWMILKSSMIGILVGAVPGTGPTIASWLSYNEAKRSSKDPQKFGAGAPEGVMASESANNAVTGGALIPLLTLGVPGDTVTAVLLSALMIQGIVPGPTIVIEHYDLISLLLVVLILANIFMLLIGLLGSKVFPYILKIKWSIMLPLVVVLCVTGGFASNSSFFDVKMLTVLGVLGFILIKFGFSMPPIVLGLILGPIVEINFRQAMLGGGLVVFVTKPLSVLFLVMAIVSGLFMYFKMRDVE